MPELPEVESQRRLLRPVMAGARFERVIVRRPTLRYPLGGDFAARLEGQTVRGLSRRAKYLVADLSSGDSLVMHLGMSGWFTVTRSASAALDRHDHVVFEMSSGATVVFNDPRRFGFMKVVSAAERQTDRALAALGPEPLGRGFTAEALARALKGKRVAIKPALVDQAVVAGLGNIYACEALHRARLSPKRKASTLVARGGGPAPLMVRLVEAIKTTLRVAIAGRARRGGSDRFLVYDREGLRCQRHGCHGTIRRIVQAGRSTFFCPVCQR
jgi:formamidopyrimidine-DNA glycosylase